MERREKSSSDLTSEDSDSSETLFSSTDPSYQAKDSCQKHNTKFCANCVYAFLPVQQLRDIPDENVSRFIKDSLKWISRHLKNIEAKGDYFKVDSYYPGFGEDIMIQMGKFADLKKAVKKKKGGRQLQKIYYFRQQLDSSMCKQRLLQYMFDNHPNSWPIPIDTSHYQVTSKHNEAALHFQIKSHIEKETLKIIKKYKKRLKQAESEICVLKSNEENYISKISALASREEQVVEQSQRESEGDNKVRGIGWGVGVVGVGVGWGRS